MLPGQPLTRARVRLRPDSAEVNSGSGSVLPHVRSIDAGTAVAVASTSLLSHCVWNCDSRHEVRVDYVVSGQLG
jgi:hypothetical protein